MNGMIFQKVFRTVALVLCLALEPSLLWGQSKIFHSYSAPPAMPDFSMEDLQGRTVTDRELRGRVLLLNFWATW